MLSQHGSPELAAEREGMFEALSGRIHVANE
jgi:hypothetical protein